MKIVLLILLAAFLASPAQAVVYYRDPIIVVNPHRIDVPHHRHWHHRHWHHVYRR